MTKDEIKLKREFDRAMENLYREIHAKYHPVGSRLHKMLKDLGAIGAVTRLIIRDEPSDAFKFLASENRFDLTVEHLVVSNEQWKELFDIETREEIYKKAEKNLKKYGYNLTAQG